MRYRVGEDGERKMIIDGKGLDKKGNWITGTLSNFTKQH